MSNFKNLIVLTQVGHHLNGNEIEGYVTFSSDELHALRRPYYSIAPLLWANLRWLRIKKNRKRGKRGGGVHRSVNYNNLTNVYITPSAVTLNKDKHLILATCNSQSLNGKSCEVLDELIESKVDLCVITETWITETNYQVIGDLNSSNFKFTNLPRQERTGGGLGIVFNTCTVKVDLKEVITRSSFQAVIWNINTVTSNRHMHVCGLYHPPYSKTNPVTDATFIAEFTELLELLLLSPDPANLCLIGDFNIKFNQDNDEYAGVYRDLLYSTGLRQLVDFPTHKSGNCLDHILVQDGAAWTVGAKIEPGPWISDHCWVRCTIPLSKKAPLRKKVMKRKLRNIDALALRSKVGDLTKPLLNHEIPIDQLACEYDAVMLAILNQLAPEKATMVTVRSKFPWFSEDQRYLKQRKRACEKKWRSNKDNLSWLEYKHSRNIYRKCLNRAKYTALNKKFRECGTDQRKLFSLVNNLTGRTEDVTLPDSLDCSLPNLFADYFKQKIVTIIDNLDSHPFYEPEPKDVLAMSSFNVIDEETVSKLMGQMSNKSCVLDPIPASVRELCKDELVPVHTQLINSSLQTGLFPMRWKEANVIPLIKKRNLDRNTLKNYRPVSNLSYVSKLTERAVMQQFGSHCESQGVLPSYQLAYRPDHSGETALLYLMDSILWSMEKQSVSILVALDLSAAFDTVNHDRLLNTLQCRAGVQGQALNWFSSYLRPRCFKVIIDGESSRETNITFSVPQGSVLGPQLFGVYSSTLPDVVSDDDIQLGGFADDHSLLKSFVPTGLSEESDIMEGLSKQLDSVKDWMDQSRLKMNTDKTEFVLFGSRVQLAKTHSTSIRVGKDMVPRADKLKLLGVTLDAELTLTNHISNKSRAAWFNLKLISSIRPYMSSQNCKQCVHALVISHLDFANAVFIGLPQSSIHKLQLVQNAAARLILKRDKYTSATSALFDLHWLPVRYRILFKAMVLVNKIVHANAPAYLKDLIKARNLVRQGLRSQSAGPLLEIPRTKRSTFADRAFSVFAPRNWNQLPEYLRTEDKIDSFKKQLKTFYFEQCFY